MGTTVFDAVGNATVEIDERGNRTTMTFDALDRQTTTTVVHDADDNATVTIDALEKRITATFYMLDWQVTVQGPSPGAGLVTTVYDKANNVVFSTIPGRKGS